MPKSHHALDLTAERLWWHHGYNWIAGVDEVGRGALAGPIVAAAVVFAADHQPLPGVYDSKAITSRQRLSLAEQIKNQAIGWAIGVGEVALINSHGIVFAQQQAMISALQQLAVLGQSDCNLVAIDGLPFATQLHHGLSTETEFIVKGDQKVYSIAAASIIAKVYRDDLMHKLAEKFPQFGWNTNVGYGTAHHRVALRTYGQCEHHRSLFCRKALGDAVSLRD